LTLVLAGYKFKVRVTEQRKNQRFNLRLPFQIVGSGKTVKTLGETRNVSSSGVLFTSKDRIPIGDPIEYFITFPKAPGSHNEVRLRCVGKVLREDTESAFAATLERYEFVRQPA
jgi:PilZ domain